MGGKNTYSDNLIESSSPTSGGEPLNPYSFINFITTDQTPDSATPDIIKRPIPSNNGKMLGTIPSNNGKMLGSHRNPSVDKSPLHMSMREMRETLEALRSRNNELEQKHTQTEMLEMELSQLKSRLEVTEVELTKSRKKCKKLQLELSENRFKEEQETVDLDRMVKKVEEKLERSEIRATAAEAELARIKHGTQTHDIEKLAWQLNQSADNAHLLVKQLCTSLNSGVEELRHIADSANQISSNTSNFSSTSRT